MCVTWLLHACGMALHTRDMTSLRNGRIHTSAKRTWRVIWLLHACGMALHTRDTTLFRKRNALANMTWHICVCVTWLLYMWDMISTCDMTHLGMCKPVLWRIWRAHTHTLANVACTYAHMHIRVHWRLSRAYTRRMWHVCIFENMLCTYAYTHTLANLMCAYITFAHTRTWANLTCTYAANMMCIYIGRYYVHIRIRWRICRAHTHIRIHWRIWCAHALHTHTRIHWRIWRAHTLRIWCARILTNTTCPYAYVGEYDVLIRTHIRIRTCVTWLLRTWDMTHTCDVTHSGMGKRIRWRVLRTSICKWKLFVGITFMCGTWLIHTCDMTQDMTHSYVWHDPFIRVTRLVHRLVHICSAPPFWKCKLVVGMPFMCETWLIRMHDMTHSYARHDSCIQKYTCTYLDVYMSPCLYV